MVDFVVVIVLILCATIKPLELELCIAFFSVPVAFMMNSIYLAALFLCAVWDLTTAYYPIVLGPEDCTRRLTYSYISPTEPAAGTSTCNYVMGFSHFATSDVAWCGGGLCFAGHRMAPENEEYLWGIASAEAAAESENTV